MLSRIVRFLDKLGFFEGILKLPRKNRVIIVGFHDIHSDSEEYGEWRVSAKDSVSAEVFEDVVKYVTKLCNVISLEEALARVYGERGFSKCTVSLTFDDGYRGQVENALSILLDYGLKATFYLLFRNIEEKRGFWWDRLGYIVYNSRRDRFELKGLIVNLRDKVRATAFLIDYLKKLSFEDRENLLLRLSLQAGIDEVDKKLIAKHVMDLAGLRRIVSKGMNIGGHSFSHPSLPNISFEEAYAEIKYSMAKAVFYSKSQEIFTFAYPFGEYNVGIMGLTRKVGFKAAITTFPKISKILSENVFSLGRIIYPHSKALFKYMATNMYYNYLRFRRSISSLIK